MNKYEHLPCSSLGFICRTCLLHKDFLLIDEVIWEGIHLKEIITDWTPLEVEDYDRLPRQMCSDCIKLMYKIYNFLSKCKRSEWTLKSILLKNDIEAQKVFEENPDLISNFVCVQKEEVEETNTHTVSSVAKILPESDEIKNNIFNSDNVENTIPDSGTDNNVPDSKDLVSSLPKPLTTSTNYPVAGNHDYCAVILKSEVSSGEEEMSTKDDPEETILHEIQTIKSDISKIRAHNNRVRLRQKMKAKLLNFKFLPNGTRKPRNKGPPYKCVSCESLFQTQDELKVHINDTHKKFFKFICEYCDSRYQNISQLEAHTRIHTGEKPYQCRTCGQSFRFKSVLKRHMISHMEVKPHRCRYCPKEFTRKHVLDQHERLHTGKRLLCRYCGIEFDTPTKLVHHEKTCFHPPPPNVTTSVTESGYQCDTCGKVLLSEKTLHAHILLHGPRNYMCETCGKAFTTNDRLLLHLRMTHQSTMYRCHLCEKIYRQKRGLIEHLESQHEAVNYFCEVCDRMFVYKGSLRQHMRVHTGDAKYKCKQCQKVCVNNRGLESHMRIHTGERPFTCDVCGKCFAEKSNFQNHYKIHSRDKDYECNVCEKVFLDFRSLKSHISTHL